MDDLEKARDKRDKASIEWEQEKHRIDDLIEGSLYGWLGRVLESGHYPDPQESAQVAPFLQMYQCIQIKRVVDELAEIKKSLAALGAKEGL